MRLPINQDWLMHRAGEFLHFNLEGWGNVCVHPVKAVPVPNHVHNPPPSLENFCFLDLLLHHRGRLPPSYFSAEKFQHSPKLVGFVKISNPFEEPSGKVPRLGGRFWTERRRLAGIKFVLQGLGRSCATKLLPTHSDPANEEPPKCPVINSSAQVLQNQGHGLPDGVNPSRIVSSSSPAAPA